jgi:hypothetical protein
MWWIVCWVLASFVLGPFIGACINFGMNGRRATGKQRRSADQGCTQHGLPMHPVGSVVSMPAGRGTRRADVC